MNGHGTARSELLEPALRPLRLGTLAPRGWLAGQLRIQAEGLSGNLDLFWPDVASSRWFGGTAEAWERAPYWLDGVVPLSFLLPGSALAQRVKEKVAFVVEHQQEDGWLGPRQMVVHAGAAAAPRYDLWAQFLALKALVQYHDATGDTAVARAVERNLRCIAALLDRQTLHDWGQARWFEALIAVQWLYERSGEHWLLDLAETLSAQGFDWSGFFERWPFREPPHRGRWTFASHVVNNAMAIKAPGLRWRHSADARDRAAVYAMIEALDRSHGMATGMFTGDECLAGRDPTRGTELCAVLEYQYSLEVLVGLFGDPRLADRLERIAFNAMPATFDPGMWAHQYDQQANQVECSVRGDRAWGTNGPESNVFGLAPNYGCCTANLSQGWPKLAAHLWMAVPGPAGGVDGLACCVYAPCELAATVRGVPVAVVTDTEYPFRDRVRIAVTVQEPVRFRLRLRIPAWCGDATIAVAGGPGTGGAGTGGTLHPASGSFCTVDREWRGTTELALHLPARAELHTGFRGAVAVVRGPLVYALPIGESWRRVNADKPHRELPHGDWEVLPTTPWNYALDVSPQTIEDDVRFEERPIGELPFSPEGAPTVARVRGRRVPGWQMEGGSAGTAPEGPVATREPLEDLAMVPYGCTSLRMTELPLLRR
jgi:hypothetical protein